MKRNTLIAAVFSLALIALTTQASAQRAGSIVDIGPGGVGADANASGMFQFAKAKSKKNGNLGFGHGFAVGAGPNGIALSNSIGVGGAQGGAAHNMNLNIGRGGAHISHGGVVSQGGNPRVVAGGHTGTYNGRVYGGSTATGFGNHTKAYSKSHTRQFGNQVVPSSQFRSNSSRFGGRVRTVFGR